MTLFFALFYNFFIDIFYLLIIWSWGGSERVDDMARLHFYVSPWAWASIKYFSKVQKAFVSLKRQAWKHSQITLSSPSTSNEWFCSMTMITPKKNLMTYLTIIFLKDFLKRRFWKIIKYAMGSIFCNNQSYCVNPFNCFASLNADQFSQNKKTLESTFKLLFIHFSHMRIASVCNEWKWWKSLINRHWLLLNTKSIRRVYFSCEQRLSETANWVMVKAFSHFILLHYVLHTQMDKNSLW